MMLFRPSLITLILTASLLTACGGSLEAPDPNPSPADAPKGPGLFSGESGNLLDSFRDKPGENGGAGGRLGVNGYLWRASLEAVSFMPLASADGNTGVIITDWHTNPSQPNERIKANVLILGKTLRPQGLKVSLFKQMKEGGEWVDTPVAEGTERKLEDTILTKARALRVQDQAK